MEFGVYVGEFGDFLFWGGSHCGGLHRFVAGSYSRNRGGGMVIDGGKVVVLSR